MDNKNTLTPADGVNVLFKVLARLTEEYEAMMVLDPANGPMKGGMCDEVIFVWGQVRAWARQFLQAEVYHAVIAAYPSLSDGAAGRLFCGAASFTVAFVTRFLVPVLENQLFVGCPKLATDEEFNAHFDQWFFVRYELAFRRETQFAVPCFSMLLWCEPLLVEQLAGEWRQHIIDDEDLETIPPFGLLLEKDTCPGGCSLSTACQYKQSAMHGLNRMLKYYEE
jgi:hypothetical protein